MAIPSMASLMVPILECSADGKDYSVRELKKVLAVRLGLSEEEFNELLPSGYGRWDTRVWWARTHLVQAKLLEAPQRGFVRITDRGKGVLSQKPVEITIKFLNQFQEHRDFLSRKKEGKSAESEAIIDNVPEEIIDNAVQQINKGLASELLDLIKSCSPEFFERLVIQLLLKMGYGGSRWFLGKI